MSVVHPHPHPKAGQTVTPSNPAVAAKFGKVLIVDWDDRVAQYTWEQQASRPNFPQAQAYKSNATAYAAPAGDEVVRCYTQSHGEIVLLHDTWLQ